MPLLAELDFKYPDDVFVMRTRAWAFLRQGKGVEAEALYNRILKTDRVSSDDYLNAGYALWFQNKIDEAVIMMRNYLIKSGGKVDLIDIFDRDSFILEENKVRKAEVYLMVDLVED